MAKVSSARPSSRQGQESGPATRATRSTRSQSHEPQDDGQPLPSRARGGRQPNPQSPNKRTPRKAKNVPDLDTVEEDVVAMDEAPTDEVELARRTSANSGMSGTTAKTSFSQEEIGELDPDVMVDVLPSLSTAAEEFCKLLVPADPKARPVVRKEIRTPGSRHNKLYNTRLASLSVNRHSFGSTEYIQPSIILRALLGVQNMKDVPQGPWRPDSVLYKINLASMLRTVLILLDDNFDVSTDGYDAIARLDVDFASAIAGEGFKPNAFRLCLALLSQLAIIRVGAYMTDPTFDAAGVIMSTFYAPDEDGDQAFRHQNVLHMMDLPVEDQETYSNAIVQLVEQLIHFFKDTEPVAALGALRAAFPWEEFVDLVLNYYFERKQELDEQIVAVGGVDQIVSDLVEEVERRVSARAADAKRQSFARAGGTPKKSFGRAAINALRAREARLAANAAPVPATAPVAPMYEAPVVPLEPRAATQDADWQRLEDDDERQSVQPTQAQAIARSTLAAAQGVQNTQRQNAAKGKGRSFLDRQPGATRVSFEDSQEPFTQFQYPASSAPAAGPYYSSPRRTPAKRPIVDVDEDEDEGFDPTQDQGFETGNQDMAAADQRRREAPQQAAVAARLSSGISSSAHGPSAPRSSVTPKRQRKNPGSSIPAPPPPYDPDDDIEISQLQRLQRAKIAARHGTMTARNQKPNQVRTPWSDEEEHALIDLIEQEGEGGIRYAELKAFDNSRGEDAMLARRDAEAMRFKARNMKEMFLKGRSTLPRNFEFIVLDKKAIVKLHNLGIPYHQDRIRATVDMQE